MKEANNVMSADKAIISVGYKDYVVDAEVALTIAKALSNAELYERKLKPEGSRMKGEDSYLYYVYDQGITRTDFTIHYLPDSLYRMAKLAGKPE
jgi:hypothetical protein